MRTRDQGWSSSTPRTATTVAVATFAAVAAIAAGAASAGGAFAGARAERPPLSFGRYSLQGGDGDLAGDWLGTGVRQRSAGRSLRGTSRADVLRGTRRNDRIYGRAGNDRLYGGAGNDRLYGGAGSDRLVGGPGNDRLVGGPGNDRLVGGPGNDTIDCGPGRDLAEVDRGDRTRGCEKVRRDRDNAPDPGQAGGGAVPAEDGPAPGGGAPGPATGRPPPAQNAPSGRPNIVLIVTDDQSLDSVTNEAIPGGSYDPLMPNVTSLLADEGLSYTSAYVTTSICCPSRSSTLTGRYAHSTGVLANGSTAGTGPANGGFAGFVEQGNQDSTVATWLHAAGYRTALTGKYLNGYNASAPGEGDTPYYVPPGWDTWRGFGGNGHYYNYTLNIDGQELQSHGDEPQDYLTDVLAGHARDFIRDSASAREPFFLYFAPKAPHYPYEPAPQDEDAFTDRDTGATLLAPHRPPSYYEDDVSDKPAWVQSMPPWTSPADDWDAEWLGQAQLLQSVDRAVGDIVADLDSQGVLDNTYIIFTSDNGLLFGEHRLGWKDNAFEEASHVPLIVRGPGVRKGTTDAIAANIDLAPTTADLAGATPSTAPDGRSLVPTFAHEPASWRTDLLLEHWYAGGASLAPAFQALYSRSAFGTYKFVQYYVGQNPGTDCTTVDVSSCRRSDERELYDLDADPFELDSLASRPDMQSLGDQLADRAASLGVCAGPSCD